MTVARITEITAQSDKGFEDAIQQGIARANKTIENIQSAWIKDQKLAIEGGKIVGWRVDMKVTFILKE